MSHILDLAQYYVLQPCLKINRCATKRNYLLPGKEENAENEENVRRLSATNKTWTLHRICNGWRSRFASAHGRLNYFRNFRVIHSDNRRTILVFTIKRTTVLCLA